MVFIEKKVNHLRSTEDWSEHAAFCSLDIFIQLFSCFHSLLIYKSEVYFLHIARPDVQTHDQWRSACIILMLPVFHILWTLSSLLRLEKDKAQGCRKTQLGSKWCSLHGHIIPDETLVTCILRGSRLSLLLQRTKRVETQVRSHGKSRLYSAMLYKTESQEAQDGVGVICILLK